MEKTKIELTISNRTIVRIIVLVLLTLGGIQLLLHISNILSLIFISLFLALALNPAVSLISRHLRIRSRAGATGIAYTLVLVAVIGFFAIVIPPFVSQTSSFIKTLPGTIQNLDSQDNAVGRFIQKYDLTDNLDTIANDMRSRFTQLPEPAITTATRIGSTFASIFAVLVMTFMMIVEGPQWIDRFWKLQPKHRRERGMKLAKQMYEAVTNYVNGQLIITLIGASFALLALLISCRILGVTINVFGLAGIVALTGLIPMIGNTIGAFIVIVVSALTSLPLALIMAVFFLVYQQIENATIQPYIQSRKNDLTPLLVFIAAIVGIGLGGILGAFVAIPLASCLKILFNDFYQTRLQNNK